MDDMYHEGSYLLTTKTPKNYIGLTQFSTGEGQFDDASADPSGAATPMSTTDGAPATKKQRKNAAGMSKKAKLAKARLAVVDGNV
jgi:DNA helicase INO80